MTKHQPSLRVQHNPGPVTGDMYTVPKKFEIKSSKSSHDYDTVVDTFQSMWMTIIVTGFAKGPYTNLSIVQGWQLHL